MAIRAVIQGDRPELRRTCKPVSELSDAVRRLAEDLMETVQAEYAGSLAAVQCGVPVSLFVTCADGTPRVWLNAEVVARGPDVRGGESCASFPGLVVESVRPEWLLVRTWTLDGRVEERRVDGVEARLVAHELDHLRGTLLPDLVSESDLLAQLLAAVADTAGDEPETHAVDEDVQQILDLMADAAWKWNLAVELLAAYTTDAEAAKRLKRLRRRVARLSTEADEWEAWLLNLAESGSEHASADPEG
ncbi:MAG: peptide deformylase [Alicyclobacillus mali]|uniref:peptide deformylase n=1 Tax=Alicyclobacillus mali (ex Roth et al. 2021) TaxID=1123961 RepID=UPI0023F12F2E|nr:peptide deformylase [Alicyclobacillus mali (ex Roth et al. 2021)]MCL6487365.1 peptide deformylase [Alicyclobacillus mali (ex Roth et al. 2021)]